MKEWLGNRCTLQVNLQSQFPGISRRWGVFQQDINQLTDNLLTVTRLRLHFLSPFRLMSRTILPVQLERSCGDTYLAPRHTQTPSRPYQDGHVPSPSLDSDVGLYKTTRDLTSEPFRSMETKNQHLRIVDMGGVSQQYSTFYFILYVPGYVSRSWFIHP